ncbi:unnamed protein product [Closterium sp. Yama58-4]|nr:unnamed protein product [Closterium sp. Yama58-4]
MRIGANRISANGIGAMRIGAKRISANGIGAMRIGAERGARRVGAKRGDARRIGAKRSRAKVAGATGIGATGFDPKSLAPMASRSRQPRQLCQPPSALLSNRLQGRWYEIGSTAGFRFTFELGLTCTTANYTAKGVTPSGRAKVKVVNRGKRSVALPRRSQIFTTSLNANRIASNLRIVCGAANAATTASAQAQTLLSANAAANSSAVSLAAADKLAAFATTVSSDAEIIDNALRDFQTEADKLNKRGQPKGFSASKSTMLKSISNIQGAAGRILQAAFTGKTAAQGLSGALRAMGGQGAETAANGVRES